MKSRHSEPVGRGISWVAKYSRSLALRRRFGLGMTAVVFCLTAPALAEVKPGDYGFGLMAGSPTGATFKYFYSNTMGVDAGMGVIGGDFALYATHLWHDFDLLPKPSGFQGELPFYIGGGFRLRASGDPRFGGRAIVGTSYMPPEKPFEFFGEFGPFFRATPDFGISLDGAVGFRYYFKAL